MIKMLKTWLYLTAVTGTMLFCVYILIEVLL